MTHSLHRIGKIGELKKDYVILAMLAAGINDHYPSSRKNLIRIGAIFQQNKPTNIMPEFAWKVSSVITASFDTIEAVKEVIKTIKGEDLGVSIVISGLISEIETIVKEINLYPHTVHLSLGVFGKKEKLPPDDILEITTMCGHHCISPQSVEYYVKMVKDGKITTEKAAEKLAKPCICGIVNPTRVISILRELI